MKLIKNDVKEKQRLNHKQYCIYEFIKSLIKIFTNAYSNGSRYYLGISSITALSGLNCRDKKKPYYHSEVNFLANQYIPVNI